MQLYGYSFLFYQQDLFAVTCGTVHPANWNRILAVLFKQLKLISIC